MFERPRPPLRATDDVVTPRRAPALQISTASDVTNATHPAEDASARTRPGGGDDDDDDASPPPPSRRSSAALASVFGHPKLNMTRTRGAE